MFNWLQPGRAWRSPTLLCSGCGLVGAFLSSPLPDQLFILTVKDKAVHAPGPGKGNWLTFGQSWEVDKGGPGAHFDMRKLKQKDWISSL